MYSPVLRGTSLKIERFVDKDVLADQRGLVQEVLLKIKRFVDKVVLADQRGLQAFQKQMQAFRKQMQAFRKQIQAFRKQIQAFNCLQAQYKLLVWKSSRLKF